MVDDDLRARAEPLLRLGTDDLDWAARWLAYLNLDLEVVEPGLLTRPAAYVRALAARPVLSNYVFATNAAMAAASWSGASSWRKWPAPVTVTDSAPGTVRC